MQSEEWNQKEDGEPTLPSYTRDDGTVDTILSY